MTTLQEAVAVSGEQTPFWQEVSDLKRTLPRDAHKSHQGKPFVYITSINDKYRGRTGNVTCEATIEVAAKCLAMNAAGGATHRLATDEEIKIFKRDQLARFDAIPKTAEELAKELAKTPQSVTHNYYGKPDGFVSQDDSGETKPDFNKSKGVK